MKAANNRFGALCSGSYQENIIVSTVSLIGWYFKADKY